MHEEATTPAVVTDYKCSYCGGTLDPRYHFCTHCASAYREADAEIYEAAPPPTLERRIREKASSAWKFFCIVAIGLISLGVVSAILGEEQIGTSLAIQEIFLFSVTAAYAVYHWRDIAFLFRGLRVNWVTFLCVPILACCLVVNKVYHDFLFRLLDLDLEIALAPLTKNLSFGALVFTICIFPGVVEEVGFRGVVQERMVKAVGTWIGFAATSALFTALHFSILSAPYLFGLSMFLCWVRARTNTIYIPIVLHFLHNLVVLVVFYGVEP